MYLNNINIIFYVLIIILGMISGQLIDWAKDRLPEYKKVFSKDLFKEYQKRFKPNYLLMIVTSGIFVALLYKFGWSVDNITNNLKLIEYVIITPLLLIAFIVDYKYKIIPNRLVLTLFEIALLFTFIYGIANINMAINLFAGMILGTVIFLIITLLGGLIAGKDAMGFGDVKLMGALGLVFGLQNILAISIISFLIGAIISIILLITKIKKMDEYIPFGPFIILSTFITIFIPFNIILFILMKIFTLGIYKKEI